MTRRLLTMTSLLCLFAPALALAQPPASVPDKPACLRQREITNFEPVTGNRALVVTDQRHHRYRVSFMGVCSGLQFNNGLGFDTHGIGGLSCIARGDSVLQPHAGGVPICTIDSVQWQTPAMDKADADAKAAMP